MRLTVTLREWFDYRPGEGPILAASLTGAFFVLAALTLARALREALFLSSFPVETLPYITATVALLSLPVVTGFTKLIQLYTPRKVMLGLVTLEMGGLLALWFLTRLASAQNLLIVVFYIWTSLGILLIASGFWVVTSDLFAVRGAKRLFGLISAGGTAGALVMGISIKWLAGVITPFNMIPLLIGLLGLYIVVQMLTPAGDTTLDSRSESDEVSRSRNRLQTIWRTRHLRTIALIVLAGTMASTMVDYQFKDALRNSCLNSSHPEVEMASFLGGFYGWTGGVALLLQLLVASRIITSRGIGLALAILPLALLSGSAGLVLFPGLLAATILRGADNGIRKSIFRPAVEILFVPLPINLRRSTKTFIDTVVDTLAEGAGAAVIFLLITLLRWPAAVLTLPVVALMGMFLILSRRMDSQYLQTIVQRLQEGERDVALQVDDLRLQGGIQHATFTRLDLSAIMFQESPAHGAGGTPPEDSAEEGPENQVGAAPLANGVVGSRTDLSPLQMLSSPQAASVREGMATVENWGEPEIVALTRILARDQIYQPASEKLTEIIEVAEPHLIETLVDQGQDFVIRRRIPRIFATAGSAAVDSALLEALICRRFEIRYRAAIALSRRRDRGLPCTADDREQQIWRAIRGEVKRDRPVWELQKLLDSHDEGDKLSGYVGKRGALSLEHTFRMLSLILEEEPVRAAFQGIILKEGNFNGLALEYLEQVLPRDIKERLWQFIGDISDRKREQMARPLDAVVSDLMATQMTLFAGEQERAALRRILGEQDEKHD